MNEDGDIIWNIEIPWSEYGGTFLGQAGDAILYAYRTPDDNTLVLNRYVQTGDLLSTHTMPKDAGRVFPANQYAYFMSEGNLKFCDTSGEIHLISMENAPHFESLFRATGNETRLVFLVSTQAAKETGYMLLALDQEQNELWSYPLKNRRIFSASEINMVISSDGRVCIADFPADEGDGPCITLLDEQGRKLRTKAIKLFTGENAWLSLIRICDNNDIIQLFGCTRTSAQSIDSWKITMDYHGEIIENCAYPEWIDFVLFTNEEPYGVLNPLENPALVKETNIAWVIQK